MPRRGVYCLQAFVERVNKVIREADCRNQKVVYIGQEFSKFDLPFCCLSMGGGF